MPTPDAGAPRNAGNGPRRNAPCRGCQSVFCLWQCSQCHRPGADVQISRSQHSKIGGRCTACIEGRGPGCAKSHPGAVSKKIVCEDCKLKSPGFGMEGDRKRRWCCGCAKSHPGAVSNKKSGTLAPESRPMKKRKAAGPARRVPASQSPGNPGGNMGGKGSGPPMAAPGDIPTFPHPKGRPLTGKKWSAVLGYWVDDPEGDRLAAEVHRPQKRSRTEGSRRQLRAPAAAWPADSPPTLHPLPKETAAIKKVDVALANCSAGMAGLRERGKTALPSYKRLEAQLCSLRAKRSEMVAPLPKEITERRLDAGKRYRGRKGRSYTKAQFIRAYGREEGLAHWNAAPETRLDPNCRDGKVYTKAQFIKAYSKDGEGLAHWDACDTGSTSSPSSSAAFKPSETSAIRRSRGQLEKAAVEPAAAAAARAAAKAAEAAEAAAVEAAAVEAAAAAAAAAVAEAAAAAAEAAAGAVLEPSAAPSMRDGDDGVEVRAAASHVAEAPFVLCVPLPSCGEDSGSPAALPSGPAAAAQVASAVVDH